MRLRAVEHRHRFPQRLKLLLIRLVSGRRVPDVWPGDASTPSTSRVV